MSCFVIINRYRGLAALGAIGTALLISPVQEVLAEPVTAEYVDTSDCDLHGNFTLTHELGTTVAFPLDERITATATPTNLLVCVGDDGISNDWDISIENLSSIFYKDLFLVADEGFEVGNFDGMIQDAAATGFTRAFKIDALGSNDNLQSESINTNGIFEPGEVWLFRITNFTGGAAIPTPMFASAGEFAVSSALKADSNLSIVAIPVPEPATLALLALPLLALRRRCS